MLAGSAIVLTLGFIAAATPDTPSMTDVGQAVRQWQDRLLREGMLAKYEITRKLLKKDSGLREAQMVGEKGDPGLYWRAEIARKKDWTYSLTTTLKPPVPQRQDSLAQVKIFQGDHGWTFFPSHKSVYLFRGSSLNGTRNALYPQEDMYSEVVGLESASQDIQVSFRGASSLPFSLADAIDRGGYRLASGDERIEGIACVLVEKPGVDRAWLDPKRGYVIIQREWNWDMNKPIKVRIHNDKFREVGGGFWLPFHSSIENFGDPATAPNQVCLVSELNVDEVKFEIADNTFDPDLAAGTFVQDPGKNLNWYMPAKSDASMKTVLDNAEKYLNQKGQQPESRINLKMFLAVNLGIGLIVAAVWVLRRLLAKDNVSRG